jgi:hypothetical protein
VSVAGGRQPEGVAVRGTFLVEAIEMTLENALAHGRGGPARLPTVNTNGRRASWLAARSGYPGRRRYGAVGRRRAKCG